MTAGRFGASVGGRSFGLLRTAARGDAEVDSRSLGSALGLVALGAEEGEGEIDAFDLTDPALGFGACSAVEEIGFELREAVQHLGVDVEHRAADAGVFVLARGAVGTSAGAEFDLAAVEVLLEFVPLFGRGVPVLALGPDLAPVLQVLLVVPDHVFVEHRDAAMSGLDVQASKQGRADVDRQAAIDEFGDEDPAEVVGGELQPFEAEMHLGEGRATPLKHLLAHAGVEDRGNRAVLPLEQERHRRTPDLVMWVVARHQRDRPTCAGMSTDDRRDHVEELGGHRDDAFPVGLRRRDDQQCDHLATGPLVLPDAQVTELAEFLDAHAGVPQRLHRRPVPERGLFVRSDVDHLAAVVVAQTWWDRRVVSAVPAVGLAQHARVAGAGEGERLSLARFPGELEQLAGVVVAGLDVLDENGQQRPASAGAVGATFVDPATACAEPVQVGGRDRAGRDPLGPPFGFLGGPGVQVVVEGTDGDDQAVCAGARGTVVLDGDHLSPGGVEVLGDPQVGLVGVEAFDLLPEVVGQVQHEVLQAAVIGVRTAAGEVFDQQTTNGLVADRIVIDGLLDALLAAHESGAHRGWNCRRQVARGMEHVPHALPRSRLPALFPGLTTDHARRFSCAKCSSAGAVTSLRATPWTASRTHKSDRPRRGARKCAGAPRPA